MRQRKPKSQKKKHSKFFLRIKKSLEEVLAHVRGEIQLKVEYAQSDERREETSSKIALRTEKIKVKPRRMKKVTDP